ncbi:hypothetical protein [Magnetococcus sp. PR-3]|uniref:hypothetical protein n=1 Tax=Magnetococcus sp. PR-3 TaxID=3120355 RepID=UPI002FCE15C5
MLLILRLVILTLAVVGAGLLPFVLSGTMDMYTQYTKAEKARDLVKRKREHYKQYLRNVKTYQAFQDRVSSFVQIAQDIGIDRGDWVRYEVDVQERMVDVSQMGFLLENARNGGHFYYDPSKFEILSSEHPVMKEKMESASSEEAGPAGSQVMVTLKGTYLVYQQNE